MHTFVSKPFTPREIEMIKLSQWMNATMPEAPKAPEAPACDCTAEGYEAEPCDHCGECTECERCECERCHDCGANVTQWEEEEYDGFCCSDRAFDADADARERHG